MATYQVSLIPGDGIGPEVTEAARRVLEATGIGFDWDYRDAGLEALEKHGDVLPEATLDSVRKNGLGL
ncbi:MAG TPA: isocitrate/isopropylmalate family dehydrogenase, partial [Thermomicrobiales bacterium]|nr:isocitrate/isopropylmalate family dehydrogenase [Thermomicrobiales bacterium]